MSGLEARQADLRERVASLEAGVKYSMTASDLRLMEQRHVTTYHELKASIAALTAVVDAHVKQTANHLETLRYYRTLLTPILAGLAIWAITGSLDLTKLVMAK